KTNAQIAQMYLDSRFNVKGQKLDAQVMATAFAVYVTNSTLAGGTYASSYGFIVNSSGTGSATYNVGSNGAAFGFANNSVHTVTDSLLAANQYAYNDVLWDTSHNGSISAAEQALRDMANTVFDGINNSGDIT